MTDHQVLFDRLTYLDKLKAAGIGDEQARAHADALDAALRDSVATRADLVAVRAEITRLENKIDLLGRDLTIRLGSMILAGVAVLIGFKFFGH